MKTLGAMFLVIILALSGMFYMWLNSYEQNHNLFDAAELYYHVEIQGENQGVYLAKQFMSELTGDLFD